MRKNKRNKTKWLALVMAHQPRIETVLKHRAFENKRQALGFIKKSLIEARLSVDFGVEFWTIQGFLLKSRQNYDQAHFIDSGNHGVTYLDKCGRGKCNGFMDDAVLGDCSCYIDTPCGICADEPLMCNVCGWVVQS